MDKLDPRFLDQYAEALDKVGQQFGQAARDLAKVLDSLRDNIPEDLKKFSGSIPEAPLTRDEAFKGVCRKDRRYK